MGKEGGKSKDSGKGRDSGSHDFVKKIDEGTENDGGVTKRDSVVDTIPPPKPKDKKK